MRIALLLLILAAPAIAQKPARTPCDHSWVSQALLDVNAIKPGITRRQLEEHFHLAGFNAASESAYYHNQILFVTIRVWFRTKRDESGRVGFSPNDVVLRVSKAYISNPPTD